MIAGVRDLPSLDAGGKSELRRAGCWVTPRPERDGKRHRKYTADGPGTTMNNE